jgi:hypothetical protein
MTVTGYGLKSVCFEREKDSITGLIDPDYTGRIMRMRGLGGGEILLRLSAGEFMLLVAAVHQVRQGLVHTRDGWRNADSVPRPEPINGMSMPSNNQT